MPEVADDLHLQPLRESSDSREQARVVDVWEGIRRQHAAPPEQAPPLRPPQLWDVVAVCPITSTWKTPGKVAEPDLGGVRDRALLLVGFVAALRRSDCPPSTSTTSPNHPNGRVLTLPRSKTNERGEQSELVVLPRAGSPRRCPVTTLTQWISAAAISAGPVFRPVSKGNRPLPRRLTAGAVNDLEPRSSGEGGSAVPCSVSRTVRATTGYDVMGGANAAGPRASRSARCTTVVV